MSFHIIREFREADLARIAELARIVYGQDPLANLAFLEWKLRKNPYRPIVATKEEDGRMVGIMALETLPVKIKERTRICAVSGDLMVLPSHRRRGIFVAIKSHLDQRVPEDISMQFADRSLKSATVRGVLKYSLMSYVGDIPTLMKYVRPFSAARHLSIYYERLTVANVTRYLGALFHMIFITLLGNLAQLVKSSDAVTSGGEKRAEVHEMIPLIFGEEFDKLWEDVKDSFPIAVVRNKEYLNWRYTNPITTYVGFRADQDGELRGYAILRYTEKGRLKTAWIMDLLATKPEIAMELVKRCLQRAKQDQADRFIMYRAEQTKVFSKALGLIAELPQKKPLLVRVHSKDIPEDLVHNISNWYLTVGDTELQL